MSSDLLATIFIRTIVLVFVFLFGMLIFHAVDTTLIPTNTITVKVIDKQHIPSKTESKMIPVMVGKVTVIHHIEETTPDKYKLTILHNHENQYVVNVDSVTFDSVVNNKVNVVDVKFGRFSNNIFHITKN